MKDQLRFQPQQSDNSSSTSEQIHNMLVGVDHDPDNHLAHTLALNSLLTPVVDSAATAISDAIRQFTIKDLKKNQLQGATTIISYPGFHESDFKIWGIPPFENSKASRRLSFKSHEVFLNYWKHNLYVPIGEYGLEEAEKLLTAGRIAIALVTSSPTIIDEAAKLDFTYGDFLRKEVNAQHTIVNLTESIRVTVGQLALMTLRKLPGFDTQSSLINRMLSSGAVNFVGMNIKFGITDNMMTNTGMYPKNILQEPRFERMSSEFIQLIKATRESSELVPGPRQRGRGCPASFANTHGHDGQFYKESAINMLSKPISKIISVL